MTDYKIVISAGEMQWEATEFMSLSYGLNLGEVTTVSVSFGDDIRPPPFANDRTATLSLMRRPNNSVAYRREGETDWLLVEYSQEFSDGAYSYNYIFAHPNIILEKRIVAYPGDTEQAEKTEDFGNNFPPDQLMIQVMDENFGVSANTSGQDRVTGILYSYKYWMTRPYDLSCPWRNILDVINELSDVTENEERTLFNMTMVDGRITFKLYRNYIGVDRTETVIFSPFYDNIASYTTKIDYRSEVNAAYVGGEGSGLDQAVEERVDDTRIPSSIYRREQFYTMNAVSFNQTLWDEGNRQLAANTPRRSITADISDTEPFLYGRDYFFGDRVMVLTETDKFECLIRSVNVSVNDGGTEEVGITLDGIGYDLVSGGSPDLSVVERPVPLNIDIIIPRLTVTTT